MRTRTIVCSVVLLSGGLAGCPSRSSSSGPPPSKEGQSVKLTAPWNEMNLSIGSGVVELSTPNKLKVRFPGTAQAQLTGLSAAVAQDLVRAGWTKDETAPSKLLITTLFTLADGRAADSVVMVQDGTTLLMITLDK